MSAPDKRKLTRNHLASALEELALARAAVTDILVLASKGDVGDTPEQAVLALGRIRGAEIEVVDAVESLAAEVTL